MVGGVIGAGVGVSEGDGVGHGVGVKVGLGKAVGVGVGVGVDSGVGIGVGISEGVEVGVIVDSGISSVSPSVALLALFDKEREDCVIAGLITLIKHTVITTKVPIPRQLHFPFISFSLVSPVSVTLHCHHSAIHYKCDFNLDSVTAPPPIHSPR